MDARHDRDPVSDAEIRAAETGEAESPLGGEPTVESAPPEGSEEEVSAGQVRLEQLENRYLRLLADFENYKRRTRNELAQSSQGAQESLVVQLLPVLDNFERALAAAEADPAAFRAGVEMIHRQLADSLAQAGLAAIEANGALFDPARHEAVMRTGDGDGPMIVLNEFRKGYEFRGKVIRPSMVQVGTGAEESAGQSGLEGKQ